MRFGLALILVAAAACAAQDSTQPQKDSQQKLPPVQQTIEVTATRTPEDPQAVPTAIEVFSGDELQARGARDLRSALALATGVDIAPGGDQGPAGSVPEFWGLKEFDAFLLVVDGVPWDGAFNPALTSLNLSDVERIEVLRGPAPVMYGATSFVGVIQVVHKDATSKDRTLDLHGGTFGTGGGSLSLPVPLGGDWASRLTLEGDRVGFSDDRTWFARGHALWRVQRKPSDSNRLWFNLDMNWIDQSPASPRVRVGQTLTPLVPVDSNQNMAGAFLDDHRLAFMGGFDRPAFGGGQWFTTASATPSRQSMFRGFLTVPEEVPDNAHGWRENIDMTNVYVDSHLAWKLPRSVHLVVGGDYLHGGAGAQGADFDYTTPLDGPAAVVPQPAALDFHINDQRDFFGAYGNVEWTPWERVRFDAGIRLNATREHQEVIDGGAGTFDQQTRTDVRPSSNLGAIFTAWQNGQDSVNLYVNYRGTFKPAAIDFGIGETGGGDLILKPETSNSVEGGMKGRFFNRRMEAEASAFLMYFNNLVTPTNVNGVPILINAGEERFRGFETSVSYFAAHDIILRGTYSLHDAIFTDFVRDFDGVLTQLAGNRIEMSARDLLAVGIQYSPVRGLNGGFGVNYTGNRYLNMRNTALAGGFATISAGLGYRTQRWELRVDGTNLNDRRDPIAESEFGDAQYYIMPARTVMASMRWHF